MAIEIKETTYHKNMGNDERLRSSKMEWLDRGKKFSKEAEK